MTVPQITVLVVLAATVALFLWGRWRHDMVAMGALLACVVTGLVPGERAFAGFGHPAVITVACVLVISRALQTSGAVDALAQRVMPAAGPTLTIAVLTGLGAVLSAFMNNVGALALLLPIALQVAARQQLPAGQVLMPLAFGSILGGMTTLIGTPPNLVVSGFRGQSSGSTFAMFDFTPVGGAVAALGIAFVALVGWRLVPRRERADAGGFAIAAYLTEVRIPEKSKVVGRTLGEIESLLDEAGAQVVGLARGDLRLSAPYPGRRLRAGDILAIEAEPEGLANVLASLGVHLEEDVRRKDREGRPAGQREGNSAERSAPQGRSAGESEPGNDGEKGADTGEMSLLELAVLPGSALVGRTPIDIALRTRFGINLLAVSRQGRRSLSRLRTYAMQGGDVLLVQGPAEALSAFAAEYGCVPLADRELRIPDRRQALLAGAILAGAVGAAVFGLVPAAIAFAGGVLAAMALHLVPPRRVYEAIDWPVIVLLGALLPVADAMATTGAADVIAGFLLEKLTPGHAVLALALVLVVTMTLSDFMNNAATAAVMCPIAIGAAERLGTSADPFLMAVAVGASCAFLTPIGHQNNTLILGPGGFRFGDYWRLGLPLEILVVAVGVPAILWAWPL